MAPPRHNGSGSRKGDSYRLKSELLKGSFTFNERWNFVKATLPRKFLKVHTNARRLIPNGPAGAHWR
jgi:hypothetical protein